MKYGFSIILSLSLNSVLKYTQDQKLRNVLLQRTYIIMFKPLLVEDLLTGLPPFQDAISFTGTLGGHMKNVHSMSENDQFCQY